MMRTGMLWFDNSQTILTVKLQKAIEYYLRKYGHNPDLILIHPSVNTSTILYDKNDKVTFNCSYRNADDKLLTQDVKISVRAYRLVLPGHIWIGIEDK